MRLSLNESHFLFSTALRAAGFPYGAVNAAVRMIQWAETFNGNGLTYLEQRRAAMRRPDPTAARVTEDGERSVAIDANGQSALLVGPLLLDLATAKARDGGFGVATAVRLRDLIYVGQLAEQAAARGLACALSFQSAPDAPGIEALEGLYSRGRTILALPDETGPLWLDSPGPSALHDELMISAPKELADDFAKGFLTAGRGTKAGVVLVCWAPEAEALDRLRDELARPPGEGVALLRPSDVAALKRRAIEEGFEVEDDDYYPLARFGLTTVIPSSEESRRQAGADG